MKHQQDDLQELPTVTSSSNVSMAVEPTGIWEKIRDFTISDEDDAFPFMDRLARDNGWSLDYSVRVFAEYKRFIYLICISERPLTPSDQVDQAWHLHLLYTRSYWSDLCDKTLGRMIHHGPTKGGSEDKSRYQDLYSRTLVSYRTVFGKEPPADIWPSSVVRFGELHFERVNMHRNWVVPKPWFLRWTSSRSLHRRKRI